MERCPRLFPEHKLKAPVCCPSSTASSAPAPGHVGPSVPPEASISDPVSSGPSAQLFQTPAHPTAVWSLGGGCDAEALNLRRGPGFFQQLLLQLLSCLLTKPVPRTGFRQARSEFSLGWTVQEDPEMPADTAAPSCAASLPAPAPPSSVRSGLAPWIQTSSGELDGSTVAPWCGRAAF